MPIEALEILRTPGDAKAGEGGSCEHYERMAASLEEAGPSQRQ